MNFTVKSSWLQNNDLETIAPLKVTMLNSLFISIQHFIIFIVTALCNLTS